MLGLIASYVKPRSHLAIHPALDLEQARFVFDISKGALLMIRV